MVRNEIELMIPLKGNRKKSGPDVGQPLFRSKFISPGPEFIFLLFNIDPKKICFHSPRGFGQIVGLRRESLLY